MKISLTAKVAIITSLVVLAISCASTLFFIDSYKKGIEREIVARGITMAESLARTVDEGLASENLELIKQVQKIVHTNDVELAQVYSSLWLPIDTYPADRSNEPPDPAAVKYFETKQDYFFKNKGNRFDFYCPVFYHQFDKANDKNYVIGFVKLRLSTEQVVHSLRETIASYVLMAVAVTIVTIALLNIFIRRSVLRPILNLQSAVAASLNDRLPETVPVCGNDEIGELTADFNRMACALKEREEQLHEKARLLEDEVAERQMAQESLQEQAAILEEEIAERQMTQEALTTQQGRLERSEAELRRNEARLKSLVNILQYQGESFQDILDYALDEALKLSDSKIGYIYYYDEDKKEFVLNSWSKGVMEECALREYQTVYPLEKSGLWGEAIRQRLPILINDFQAPNPLKRGYPDGHAPLKRFMTIPITSCDKIVAVIGVANKETDYDKTDALQITLLMDSVWKAGEQKRTEAENLKLQSQLLQAQKMESVGRLAGGVAHDFNNMLSVILGYAEMSWLKLPEGNVVRNSLQEIIKAAEHSRDITRQLLAFSRKEIISPKPVNLNKAIIDTEKTLARLIGEDIVLRFKPASNLWTIRIDPSQVDQIFVNLAVNARDAMSSGGDLTIETGNIRLDEGYCNQYLDTKPGDYVQLTISDSGIGMDRETREHIFEPFFTTKDVGKGTGLGLATVYGIVTQNNGFINVYSEPGHGTTFKVYFPRMAEECATESAALPVPISGSGTVLLVEDDDTVREMTAEMLETIGYTVLKSATPQAAVAMCADRSTSIDVILSDVIMPEMSGKEMHNKIEALRPGIRVVFMSGYTSDVIAQRGILEKGMHFIQKPFDMNTLNQKIIEASC